MLEPRIVATSLFCVLQNIAVAGRWAAAPCSCPAQPATSSPTLGATILLCRNVNFISNDIDILC